jgi:hypothetical protein
MYHKTKKVGDAGEILTFASSGRVKIENREIRNIGSETTYLHLKAYRCVIPQPYRLKVL